jgi:DNA polymerase V
MPKQNNPSAFEIFSCDIQSKTPLPSFLNKVAAGFPSPAEDYLDRKLDLNDLLVKNPAATFFVKVAGNSMINAGIKSGDYLIIDRSIEPKDKRIVVAIINGEFTVKRIHKQGDKLFLDPENDSFTPIEIKEDMDFQVWGTVTQVIHAV